MKKSNPISAVVLFILLPILFYVLGDFPRRTILKEIISLVTILAFFMMIMQFYLSRANKKVLQNGHKMSKVVKWHKVLGYVFVGNLMIHPILIVIPRYLEAGVEPMDAFTLLITTFSSKGIILGIIAWCVMIIIGLTSIFRNRLGMSYKTWRTIHGVLSILFIGIASFHVTNLGRHINSPMAVLIAVLAFLAVTLLLKTYLFKSGKPETKNHG